jgi:Peptidase family M28
MPTENLNHTGANPSAAFLSAIVLALLALITLAMLHASPTPAQDSNAPAPAFSAARAMPALRQIAANPHPIGSAEHDKVRDFIMARLEALGLVPEIQTRMVSLGSSKAVARVQNIVVRVPGNANAAAGANKALLLVAHYDSVPTSPGAGDDGASVAAILETLRALKAGPALKNDVIVLLSDGEEVGLMGAAAFAEAHPWAKQVGMVLNFEYRGNSGPVWMFETSSGNGKLIQGYGQAAPHPISNSLLYEVYKKMPNDTDLTIFKRANLPGLNFAAAERHNSYHTMLDTPDLLDQASLQHQGETILAMTRHFGQQSLNELASDDRVYFHLPAFGLVHYPVAWVLPLSAFTLLLVGALVLLCIKSGAVRPGRILLGLPGLVAIIAVLAAACHAMWSLILSLHPGYKSLIHGATYNDAWYLLFFLTLALSLFMLLQTLLKRWISTLEFGLAAFLLWALLLAATSVALPGGSFLFTWPLLPMLLAWLFLAKRAVSGNLRGVILLAAASPAVIVFTPIVHLLYTALTPAMAVVPIIFFTLLLALLNSLLDDLSQQRLLRFVPPVAAMVFFGVAALTSGFSPERPRQNSLFHVEVPATQQAFWVSSDVDLDSWTRPFFNPGAKQLKHDTASDLFGSSSRLYWRNPAPRLNLPAPLIELVEDRIDGALRTVKLEVRSQRLAPRITIRVEGIEVKAANVEGEKFVHPTAGQWEINAFAMLDKPVRLELTLAAGKGFSILVRDISWGLPAALVTPRPADMMPQAFRTSDTQQVLAQLKLK